MDLTELPGKRLVLLSAWPGTLAVTREGPTTPATLHDPHLDGFVRAARKKTRAA